MTAFRRIARGVLFLTALAVASAGFLHAGEATEHGRPVVFSGTPSSYFPASRRPALQTTSFTDGQVSGFSVDTDDRADVVAFYHCIYQASEGFESRMNWSGAAASCDEGTVSQDFHDDTLRRINYYRAMVGLNADITFDTAKNQKCQEAAIMMSRANALSHDPDPAWPCYTADGDEAANHSNLSRSTAAYYTGPVAIDGQIEDEGVNNVPLGHRRWLLYSRSLEMGNGGVSGELGYSSVGVIWVVGDFGSAPASPEWAAWPNQGYTPFPLMPARWSLSLPGADFDASTVTMTLDGSPVTLTKIHPTPSSPAIGYGDATIVWEPDGLPASLYSDTAYTVTVSGIAGVASTSVTYEVTLIDVNDPGTDIVASGPTNPVATVETLYTFDPVEDASSYYIRTRTFTDGTWTEGAEDSPEPQVLDGTSADYELIQSSVAATGSKGFHLAFPSFVGQSFEVDRTIVPRSSSVLSFVFRRRFSSLVNTIAMQVSDDDGVSWTTAWQTNGLCNGGCSSGDWDPSWLGVSVPLGSYDGMPIRIRGIFDHNGSAYVGTTSSYGVFFDDITVSDSREQVDIAITNVPGGTTSFSLSPDGVYSYLVDLSIETECHTFGYGSDVALNSVPHISITSIGMSGGDLQLGMTVTGGNCTTYELVRCPPEIGDWLPDTNAVYDADTTGFTTQAGTTGPCLYRIHGTGAY